ncbi:MAG: hypothetical protein WD341_07950 [Tistlia sp.]|uniref:hypothetical protein n=1 Tax=Tistlia sp. TaxID=3057121 RepID=UPI0034A33391
MPPSAALQLAQGSQPIQLFQLPDPPATGGGAAAPSRPDPGREGGYQGGGFGEGGFGDGGLEGGGLGGPLGAAEAPERLGLWTRDDGGLGYDLWRGSRRETVVALLARLSGTLDSPTLRTLVLRVLLSEAETPGESVRAVVRDGGPGQNLLVLRGRALLALGESAYLGALLDLVEGEAAGAPDLLELKTQASLLTGDYGQACATARDGVAREPGDAFWTKAQVACQAATGENDAAMLGLDLLRESGEGADQGFSALAAAALGYGEAPADPAPSALNVALVLGSDLAPPASWQDSRDPAVLAMAARDGDLGRDRRLALAERAAAAGAIQAEELVGFYEAGRLGADQIGRAASLAAGLAGPEARALLYVAARGDQGPARGELIPPALASARADGVELGVARAFAPLLAELQPSDATPGLAQSAARALFLAGRYELAGSWIDELRRSVGVDPTARQALVDLWPLARLAGVEIAGGPQDLSGWRSARQAGGSPEAELHAEVVTLRGLLYALGETDALAFGELIGSESAGPLTGTSTLLALEQAAVGARLGETVLLAALVIAENGVAGHPYPTAKAVEALNRVDRPGEARALALEAAVARGL